MVPVFFDRMIRAVEMVHRRAAVGRTISAFERLDDRVLRDIGVNRVEIPQIARRAVNDNRRRSGRVA